MKIYTKTGDAGVTGLFGGDRVPKDAARIEAYGEIDELNAAIGAVRTSQPPPEIDPLLVGIQNDLFVVGSDLATPLDQVLSKVPRITAAYAARLEREIDRLDAVLPPLTSFILPGGTPSGAMLQLARTICRRAERHVVTLSHSENIGPDIIIYLNRLSDLLFVLARYANFSVGCAETPWSGNTPTP
jgi:cob(I)alamin adenosyltransferase